MANTIALGNERTQTRARNLAKHHKATHPSATGNELHVEEEDGGDRKKKITISLSPKSMRAFQELKEATDADPSEVFRNALRLHLTLLRAYRAGTKLYMKKDNSEEIFPVTLFVDLDQP
jgi:hypothetical protein